MSCAYYNENDAKAAEWIRELIREGVIAPGDVDERSIEDVRPSDLAGYRQCHFFAGIGGWSYALRMAGWPDSAPVWTGSCPCQPFSVAGARLGLHDPRHLWPIWRWLIDQCRPVTVFGEQVASPDGRAWLTGVRADVDVLEYAFGAADLCVAGVGAPQLRQRLFWVAYRQRNRWREGSSDASWRVEGTRSQGAGRRLANDGGSSGMADAELPKRGCDRSQAGIPESGERQSRLAKEPHDHSGRGNAWANAIWIPCADGKARRIEPGLEPLVDGLPGRVGLLRGYGNAISPQVGALFIEAARDVITALMEAA